MSRKGDGWDNALMERFFQSLQTEWIAQHGYRPLEEMIKDAGEYLMGYYSWESGHSSTIMSHRNPGASLAIT